jgi:uncharacterized phage protein (TIGR01671 family)
MGRPAHAYRMEGYLCRLQPYSFLYRYTIQRARVSLMQFTGLQDKAGRDIYEGDVVKDRFGRIMQVQWWNFRLCWVAISETNFHHADLYDWVDFDYEKEEKSSTARVEVIGNVYENPELITHVSPQS